MDPAVTTLIQRKQFSTAVSHLTLSINKLNRCTGEEIKEARVKQGLSETPQNGKLFHPAIPRLLDVRYKCHMKMGDYESAYTDAQEMVSLLPFGVKGYLRSGLIMELRGLWAKAVEIYSQGLSNISEAQKRHNFSIDSKLYTELLNRQIAARSKSKKRLLESHNIIVKRTKTHQIRGTDFVQWFPLEILELIFSHLPTTFIVQSCLMVLWTWNRTLSCIPELFLSMRFQSMVHSRELIQYLTFFRHSLPLNKWGTIKTLKIHKIASSQEQYILRKLVSGLEKVRIQTLSLNLNEVDLFQLIEIFNNYNGLPFFQSLSCLELVISTVPFCEEILLSLLPNLHTLQLIITNGCGGESGNVVVKPQYMSFIEEALNGSSEKTYDQLKKLTVVASQKLKRYYRDGIPFGRVFSSHRALNIEILNFVGFDMEHLFEQEARNPSNNSYSGLFQLPKLKLLFLEGNKGISFKRFLQAHTKHPNFESLNLTSIVLREHGVNDLGIPPSIFEIQCLRNLATLDLSHTSMNADDLKHLLKLVGSGLRVLNLDEPVHLHMPDDLLVIAPGRPEANDFKLAEFIPLLPNLESLSFASNFGFSDFTLTQFRKDILAQNGLPKLKVLNLSLTRCTGTGILNFFGYQRPVQKKQVFSSMNSKVKKRSSQEESKTLAEAQRLPFRLAKLIALGMEAILPVVKEYLEGEYLDEVCLGPSTDYRKFMKNTYIF